MDLEGLLSFARFQCNRQPDPQTVIFADLIYNINNFRNKSCQINSFVIKSIINR